MPDLVSPFASPSRVAALVVALAWASALAACDRPRRSGGPSPAGPGDAVHAPPPEASVSAPFDHAAAYRAFLASVRIADPGDRVLAYDGLAAGDVRCFALREGDGVRLKACVTPTGVVRAGGATGDDWRGLLAGAPAAAAAATWIAWLETDESPGGHAPRIPRPLEVLTPATAAGHGYADDVRARVTAPALTRVDDELTLVAWIHVPGATVPVRWTVYAGPGGNRVERRSAVELP